VASFYYYSSSFFSFIIYTNIRIILSIQIKNYTLVEDDRMIIYTNEIAQYINKTFPEQNTTAEDISAGVVKYLEWAGIDIEVVDGDVIIWGKFKVDF
jgi:hypothetical protein